MKKIFKQGLSWMLALALLVSPLQALAVENIVDVVEEVSLESLSQAVDVEETALAQETEEVVSQAFEDTISEEADMEAMEEALELAYEKVNVINPIANTWNTGTTYPNDGGPEFAFNDNTGNWWHTNYGGAEDGNKNVSSFTNEQVSQIPAFSEISENRVWIGGEFENVMNLGKFTYRARTNNQTENWIEQWALYTANVTTGEPTDADFVLASNGTFGQECSGTNAVDIAVELTAPVKATHFRLVAFKFNGDRQQHLRLRCLRHRKIRDWLDVIPLTILMVQL